MVPQSSHSDIGLPEALSIILSAAAARFTPMVPENLLAIRRGWIIEETTNATRYLESGPKGLCRPKTVSNENEEGSTAFEPWSLLTVLRVSSGAHDATTRAGERLAKIAAHSWPHQHAEGARLTRTTPGLQTRTKSQISRNAPYLPMD
jgi:hypothetical protein